MSDLISREVVIDVLKQTGIIQDNDRGHLVVDEINRIPTAYDVEKVIEQMKAYAECNDDCATNFYEGQGCKACAFNKMIEIAKAGGIDG